MGPLQAFAGLVFVCLLVGVPVYLWIRLVRGTTRPGSWRRRIAIAVALAVPVMLVASFAVRRLDPYDARWIAWPLSIAESLVLFTFGYLALLELPRLIVERRARSRTSAGDAVVTRVLVPVGASAEPGTVGGVIMRPGEPPGAEVDRRLFLGRSIALLAGTMAAGTTAYGLRNAIEPPRIRRVPVTLGKLPQALDGFRIATVSDIHLGTFLQEGHTERLVRMLNGLKPDLIAIVGDVASGTTGSLGQAARPLRSLDAATFYVTGNHEYFWGADDWVHELTELGIRALRNERVEIGRGGARLDLAGIEDIAGFDAGGGPDFAAALDGRDTSRPVVLLAHQPVQVFDAAQHGVDLQLSGHTHGGQLLPFGYLERVRQPVLSGLETIEGTQVFVTNGAGFSDLPLRIGAPPEIAVVELRAPR